jgi:hypothetical protein
MFAKIRDRIVGSSNFFPQTTITRFGQQRLDKGKLNSTKKLLSIYEESNE